jgi:fructose-specific phosphotransferase system IIC component
MIALWIALGLAAWVSATFSPIYLFAQFRRRADRARFPWLVNSLFAPAALLVGWVSAWLLLWTIGELNQPADHRGIGSILLFPAMLVLLSAVITYYVLAVVRAFRHQRPRAAKGR